MELIDRIWKDHIEFADEFQKGMRDSYEFGVRVGTGNIQPDSMEPEVRNWISTIMETNDRRQNQYLAINKRIEELLARDDAT